MDAILIAYVLLVLPLSGRITCTVIDGCHHWTTGNKTHFVVVGVRARRRRNLHPPTAQGSCQTGHSS
jgi:hypothetical protein